MAAADPSTKTRSGRKAKTGYDGLAKELLSGDASSRLATSKLSNSVGFLLRLANGVASNNLASRLATLGLRQSLYSVMLIIQENPGLKQQEVGQALSIQQPNLVALINDLIDQGLVAREVNAQDRRSYSLTLTAAGKRLLQKANRLHDEYEQALAETIAPLDVEDIRAALLRLTNLPPG